jgi:hypothetical protein
MRNHIENKQTNILYNNNKCWIYFVKKKNFLLISQMIVFSFKMNEINIEFINKYHIVLGISRILWQTKQKWRSTMKWLELLFWNLINKL